MSFKDFHGRDFLHLQDFETGEVKKLLKISLDLKQGFPLLRDLEDKVIALIFEKPSTRTRISLEVAAKRLGGSCLYMVGDDLQLGKREPIKDTAKVLERYVDGIAARVYSHDTVTSLAKYSQIPIINALSDLNHPLQILADLLTVLERFGRLKGVKIAYIGDGNNVCNSLLIGCSKVGVNFAVACPKGYEPNPQFIKWSKANAKQSGSEVNIVRDPFNAVKNADIVYSDVFVSMGFESEKEHRIKTFFPKYQVTQKIMEKAKENSFFMHPLPCHRGEEVEESVIDGSKSLVWDQAENRLYTAEAVLAALI